MKNNRVSNKELEKVIGGFRGARNYMTKDTWISVTQEEYDCLVDGGYIVDGKCESEKWEDVAMYLADHDYDGGVAVVVDPASYYLVKANPKIRRPYIEFRING